MSKPRSGADSDARDMDTLPRGLGKDQVLFAVSWWWWWGAVLACQTAHTHGTKPRPFSSASLARSSSPHAPSPPHTHTTRALRQHSALPLSVYLPARFQALPCRQIRAGALEKDRWSRRRWGVCVRGMSCGAVPHLFVVFRAPSLPLYSAISTVREVPYVGASPHPTSAVTAASHSWLSFSVSVILCVRVSLPRCFLIPPLPLTLVTAWRRCLSLLGTSPSVALVCISVWVAAVVVPNRCTAAPRPCVGFP